MAPRITKGAVGRRTTRRGAAATAPPLQPATPLARNPPSPPPAVPQPMVAATSRLRKQRMATNPKLNKPQIPIKKSSHKRNANGTVSEKSKSRASAKTSKKKAPVRNEGGLPIPPEIIVVSGEELLQFEDPELQTRALKRAKKRCSAGLQLQVASLNSLGVYDRFLEYFDAIGWKSLLFLRSVNLYVKLCEEFVVSFRLNKQVAVNVFEPCISFRMGLQTIALSINDWNLALGLISSDDLNAESYQSGFIGNYADFPGFNPVNAWKLLAHACPESYDANKSNVHWLADPVLRLCCMFILRNVFGRSTTFTRVSQPTLFILWCMHCKHKLNPGYLLADTLNSIAHDSGRHMTLCVLVGVLIDRNVQLTVPATFEKLTNPQVFDLECMRKSNLIYDADNVVKFPQPGPPNPSLSSSNAGNRTLLDEVHSLRADVQLLHMKLDALAAQNGHIQSALSHLCTAWFASNSQQHQPQS